MYVNFASGKGHGDLRKVSAETADLLGHGQRRSVFIFRPSFLL